MNTWYSAGSGNQGLVIEEGTGRNVAVSYDEKDAKLLASSPALLETLRKAVEELEWLRNNATIKTNHGDYIDVEFEMTDAKTLLYELESYQ